MRTTSAVSFYCRNSKKDRNGYAPLECSITISGQRKFFNLPIKFKPFGKRPPKEVLEAMDLWRSRITQYQIQMMKEGMVVTAETLRQVIQEGGVRAYTIGRLFDDKLLLLRKRVGVDLKQSAWGVPIIMHYKTLPVISNQKMNAYLKEIGKIADIPNLTSHYGRRSFATMMANRNVSMDAVAAALGDNPQIAVRYYAKVFDSTMLNEQMKAIREG